MSIITLPAKFSFTAVTKFALERGGNIVRSRYTGLRTAIVYPYAVWVIEGSLVEYDGDDAGALRSFLMKLEGYKNTFRLPVPGYYGPSTGYSGDVAIKTPASARVGSFVVKGGTPSQNMLAEGDFFTINDELKIATNAVTLDGSGEATVNFKPETRAPVAVDDVVVLQNPTCLMHSAEDDAANWPMSPPFRHKIKIKAVEAIES